MLRKQVALSAWAFPVRNPPITAAVYVTFRQRSLPGRSLHSPRRDLHPVSRQLPPARHSSTPRTWALRSGSTDHAVVILLGQARIASLLCWAAYPCRRAWSAVPIPAHRPLGRHSGLLHPMFGRGTARPGRWRSLSAAMMIRCAGSRWRNNNNMTSPHQGMPCIKSWGAPSSTNV